MRTIYLFLASFAVCYFIFLSHFANSQAKEIDLKPEDVDEQLAQEQVAEPIVEVSASTEVTAPSPQPEVVEPLIETPEPTSTPEPTVQVQPVIETPIPSPQITPEPTSTPAVPAATPDVWSPPVMEPIFTRWAGAYGVDKNILERLAVCESHFNLNAQNGDYLGLFQFSTSTWHTYRARLGLDGNPELRRDAEASIQTAAYVVQQKGTAPWPKCI